MNQDLVNQYTVLCARLGDLTFKREALEKEISSIKDQIEALAQINKKISEAAAQKPAQEAETKTA